MPVYDENGVRILHFGFGDLSVLQRKPEAEGPDDFANIVMIESESECHEIGTDTGSRPMSNPVVVMVFEKPESVDVVISALQRVKDHLTAQG